MLVVFIFILSYCLQIVDSKYKDYSVELERYDIIDKLKLLQPSVLTNRYYDLLDIIEISINETCARDFAIYVKALFNRESWAVRSK